MKSLLCALSLLVIMLHYSSTMNMDFDKEKNISLEQLSTTYKQTTLNTATIKSANQQFTDFEEKIKKQYPRHFGALIYAHANDYFNRATEEAPAIIANYETIKKFSLIKNSYYALAIEKLFKDTQSHYENVTCNTLSIINNPKVSQSSYILNKQPYPIKAYLMQCVYDSIGTPCIVVNLSKNCSHCSIHSKTHIAATSNDVDGIFQIYNLQTGTSRTLSKKSIAGNVELNTNGSQLATQTIAQNNPKIIDVDIWDCQTGNNTHTLHHPEDINMLKFVSQDHNQSKLIIFDKAGYLLIYTITINTGPILTENLKLSCTITEPYLIPESLDNEYKFYNNNKIYKKCPAFYLCSQAIENTHNIASLSNIKTAALYLSLTPLEKNLIDKKVEARKTTHLKQ